MPFSDQDFALLCQINGGTTLGALKFGGILPWELDADLIVHIDNATAYKDSVLTAAKNQGYEVVSKNYQLSSSDLICFYAVHVDWENLNVY